MNYDPIRNVRVALADDAAGTFDRVREEEVRLEPGRVLVIGFGARQGRDPPALAMAALALPARGPADLAVERVDALLDAAFGQRLNPMRHLGALGFFFFWICCASGIWIYVGLDTSATGARESLAAMDRGEWPLGAFARALHRYSADAVVLVTALHIVRGLARRHYAAFRRYAWLTGLAVLALLYAAGIGGYWLPWGQLGQWSLTATTEWLDALPVFDGALTRNVVDGNQVSDRFFSLLIFLHIGLPLAMLATMWAHVQRVSPARTSPPRALAAGPPAMLAALCLAKPVSLMPPADLGLLPARIPLSHARSASERREDMQPVYVEVVAAVLSGFSH